MKRIKTFGQFIKESFSIKENSAPRISSNGKRPTRAEGSPNWFTERKSIILGTGEIRTG